ncbi:MAG: hypothetical protein MJ252_08575 [archaeon]|nr:hypothetical protein [archaeon]
MSSGPNSSYNTIKGLQIFINDIRDCATKEAEAKRVEEELDKIRKKLSTTSALSGYEKKKCIWKLLYIYILGYKIDFGHNYACDLITSIRYSEKMAGYICISLLFRQDAMELGIMINSIKNDLLNKNPFSQSMALTLACNMVNHELMEAIIDPVEQIIEHSNERSPYTIKKALICYGKILKYKKEIHDASKLAKSLIKIIEMKNFECLMALTGLVYNNILLFGQKGYEPVVSKLLNSILFPLIEKKREIPEEYIYYHIKAPWVQIKILKILQLCDPNSFGESSMNNLKSIVEYYGKKTSNIVSEDKKFQRIYSAYSIFFEAVNVLDHFNLKMHFKTFDVYIYVLGQFLNDDHKGKPNKDINTKYLALDGLAKLSKYTNGNKILKEHATIILQSLRDNDVSIRRRALDLLFLTCTQDSVKLVCRELLLYLKEDEPQLKDDITLKIAILSEKYATDYFWYIDVCIKMLELAGDFVSEDIIYRIVQVVTGFENKEPDKLLQIHACERCISLLKKDYAFENVVRLSAFLLGEFGFLLQKKTEMEKTNNATNSANLDSEIITLETQADLLWKHSSICSNQTIYCIMNAMMKFENFDNQMREYAIPRFEQLLENWDPELQQRAVEYIILSKLDGEDPEIPNINEIRATVFSPMPLYSQEFFDNSILMKKLQKTQSGKYSNPTQQKNPTQPTMENTNPVQPKENSNTGGNNPYTSHELYSKDPSGFATSMNKNPMDATLIEPSSINNFDMFKSMLTTNNANGGIIYSDQNTIKVSLMIKKLDKQTLGFVFAFTPFTSGNEKIENVEFSLNNYNSNEKLNISISKVKYDPVPQVMMKIQMVEAFETPPQMKLSFNLGMRNIQTGFSLPLLVTKYFEPYNTPIENFVPLWMEITQSTDESTGRLDSIMYNPMSNSGKGIMDFLQKLGMLMKNLNFKVYTPENKSDFHEIQGGALLSGKEGEVPVLFQASFIPSNIEEFRFSLRCKCPNPNIYSNLLQDVYAIVKMWVNPS